VSSYLMYIINVVTTAAVYAVFVLGLNLQFGYTGIVNFGHVAFMAIGAYTTVLLSLAGWPLIAAIAAGVLLAALASLLIGLPALRLREDYLAITTIGFAEVIRIIINNEVELTRGPQGIFRFPLPFESWGLSPLGWRVAFMILCLVTLAAVYLLLQRLTNSPWGRVLKAIREDEDAAIALGKNTRVFKLWSLALGSAIAGLSGVLLAYLLAYINPREFLPLTTFTGWMIMVLGGAGSNVGVMVGSLLYFGLFSLTRPLESSGLVALGLTGQQVGALRVILIGIFLVVLMMYRPQGLFGRKEELSLDR